MHCLQTRNNISKNTTKLLVYHVGGYIIFIGAIENKHK